MAVEIASAYVSLVPSAKGFAAATSAQLAGPLAASGASAGSATAASFGAKFAAGMAVAAAAGAAAIAGIGVALFKVGESFDSAFDTIRVGTGATGEALLALEGDFKSVISAVPASFDDASQAIADLNTRLGLSGKPLQDMSVQLLNLSRITETDLGTNIEATTRLLGDWGIASEEAAGAIDMVFRASQATGPSVDTLSRLMVQFGGPMRQLGFSFEETAALLGKFEKEGVNTELVMGSMRVALGRMAREGEAPVATLNRTIDAIANAGDAGSANALALELFGARAGPDMAAAIREGRFEIDDLAAAIAGGSETINAAAADTESFGEKWTRIKNKVLVGIEPIASRLFEAMGDGMDWLAAEVLPDLQRGMDRLAAWWAQEGPGILAAGREIFGRLRDGASALAEWLGPRLGDAITAVRSALASFSAWWESDGQGIATRAAEIFGGISEFVTGTLIPAHDAFVALLREKLGPAFSEVWATIGPILSQIVQAVTSGIGNIVRFVEERWPKIQETISYVLAYIEDYIVRPALAAIGFLWEALGEDLLDIVDSAWRAIQGIIAGLMQAIGGIIDTAMALITGDWSGAWQGIKDFAGGIWDAIYAGIRGFLELIGNALQGLGSLLWDLLGIPLEKAKGWASSAVDAIAGFMLELPGRLAGIGQAIADAIVGALKTAWNAAASVINDMIPDEIGVGIGPAIDLPDNPLPKFHSGGIVPGLPGQEILAILEAGERIIPAGAAAAAGGLTINHRYDGIPAAQAIELAVVRQRRDLEGALGAAMIGG